MEKENERLFFLLLEKEKHFPKKYPRIAELYKESCNVYLGEPYF